MHSPKPMLAFHTHRLQKFSDNLKFAQHLTRGLLPCYIRYWTVSRIFFCLLKKCRLADLLSQKKMPLGGFFFSFPIALHSHSGSEWGRHTWALSRSSVGRRLTASRPARHTHTHTHIYTHTPIHTHWHTLTHTKTHTHTHTHTHTQTYTQTHTHTYAHTHLSTHTDTPWHTQRHTHYYYNNAI